MLTHARLIELLDYDPQTGAFVWAISYGFKSAGTVAASKHITLMGKTHLAANLAWFYVRGRWPVRALKYVNGNRDDIRIGNLIERGKHFRKAQLGAVSVTIEVTDNGFRAFEYRQGKVKELGTDLTFAEAAYKQWEALNV